MLLMVCRCQVSHSEIFKKTSGTIEYAEFYEQQIKFGAHLEQRFQYTNFNKKYVVEILQFLKVSIL